MDVRGRKALVVGLGRSGYESAGLLAREGAIVKVTESSDTDAVRQWMRELSDHSIDFEIGAHTERFCADADFVVTSPGVDRNSLPLVLAENNRVPLIGELELGFQFCRAPIIAVTGTNGKSTTTELIGSILSSAGRDAVVCGNIGNPLSGEVDRLTSESVAVVEVSSFQLETIKDFKPRIAVLLNIAEDHYDRHGDLEKYSTEKLKIFKNQTENDWAVMHTDFCGRPEMKSIKGRPLFFNARKDMILKPEEIPLKGAHNLDNVACAAVVSRIMGLDAAAIRNGVMRFKGLDHRFEKIGDFKGVEFIDDSKATNIDATRRALESTDKPVVLIAGGRDKGGDYGSLRSLAKDRVKAMVLIGEARGRIKDAFSSVVPILEAGDMAEAVEIAFKTAASGDIVMLSSMCSSFDMFSSYKERGEAFRREVGNLRKGSKEAGKQGSKGHSAVRYTHNEKRDTKT